MAWSLQDHSYDKSTWEYCMDLFRHWRNNVNPKPLDTKSINLEVEICYFGEDDKEQLTLNVPFSEYVDAPSDPRFG
tara:strand:+ start:758 stop:985 length:228 start_codon:yes stop_codon:yes gene_type:complete